MGERGCLSRDQGHLTDRLRSPVIAIRVVGWAIAVTYPAIRSFDQAIPVPCLAIRVVYRAITVI